MKEPQPPAVLDDSEHPSLPTRFDEVTHYIDDIARGDDLVRYAVQAQLYRIDHTPDQMVGPGSPIDKAELSRCLAGSGAFLPETLRALDDAITVLGRTRSHTGGLASFGLRMREVTDHASVSARIPALWTRDMRTKSHDEIHVLVQASTLVNSFIVANEVGMSSGIVRDQGAGAIAHVADRLILLAGGPPTPRHYEAQALLGSLAKFAFEIVLNRLEASIRRSPLGFRSWRPLTKLLMIARNDQRDGDDALAQALRHPLTTLVQDASELRSASINPGRSLDLELLVAIPWNWAGEDQEGDRVTRVLLERAEDGNATLRERGTAAMGLWQRAVLNHRVDDQTRRKLRELAELFDDRSKRPDIASGLSWVARTLETAMERNTAIVYDWPTVDEPWYRAVFDAADTLDLHGVPDSIRIGTRNLFFHSLLQNAGVERRKLIDTLRTGGLVEPVASAFVRLLNDARTEAWIRVRVLFALGFMHVRDVVTHTELVAACSRAFDAIARGARPSRSADRRAADGVVRGRRHLRSHRSRGPGKP